MVKGRDERASPAERLRARAEQELRDSASIAELVDPTLHEPRVHEAELRIQNEALRDLHAEGSIMHERYRDLFEHAPVPYVVLEHDSRVIEANRAAAGLLLTSRTNLIGSKLSTLIDAQSVEPFARHIRATAGGAGVQRCELRLSLRDGEHRDVRLESVRDRLAPHQWRCALIDITAARQLQRQLQRSQRLEAIGTFASGIAHDFANVLAVIAGSAEVAGQLVEEPKRAGVPLERIKHAAEQGRSMVGQLLRFASGSQMSSMEAFDLDQTIRGMEATVRELLGPAIALRLELQAPNVEVSLDPGGPQEILLNLASNALHAMPRGGELVIETRVIDARAGLDPGSAPRRFVQLSVTDTGKGMDGRTQARVFEPFFTTKPPGKGTGLGLAMVHGIVSRGGGHVELTSEPHSGTTFRAFLPIEPPHACATSERSGEPSSRNS